MGRVFWGVGTPLLLEYLDCALSCKLVYFLSQREVVEGNKDIVVIGLEIVV